ncbi:hypothetical protein B0T10DRAFT_459285 [Thelonectria olida]|uniref:Uncharacterized protein n=1 Tax=Thelonectria olida TaxID=1576542 RepID=A0A9P9ATB1_9HYPO|nr:hypothetical protein B0T10DRAFT_459285 [Thelonectria olida]
MPRSSYSGHDSIDLASTSSTQRLLPSPGIQDNPSPTVSPSTSTEYTIASPRASNFRPRHRSDDLSSEFSRGYAKIENIVSPVSPTFNKKPASTKRASSTTARRHTLSSASISRPPGDELRKVPCDNTKSTVLGHFALFHLPAIATTFTILFIHIARVTWDHPSTEALEALQFAAKAHEALILLSLTDILLHWICYRLLIGDGISLGFVSSAFYLGSPIQYLLSRELWSAALYPTGRRLLHTTTGAMIVLIALLCIGANPLSAIVMIPRQGWWYVPTYYEAFDLSGFYHVREKRKLYQPNLTSSQYDTLKEVGGGITLTPFLQSVYPLVTQFEQSIMAKPPIFNLTYQNYGSYAVSSRRTSLVMRLQKTSTAITTCPLSAISSTLMLQTGAASASGRAGEWTIKSGQKEANSTLTKWKQPLIAVECSEPYVGNGTTASFYFENLLLNKTLRLDAKKYPALTDLASLAKKNDPDLVGYRLLNLWQTMKLNISSAVLFGSLTYDFNTTIKPNTPLLLSLNLCLISAHWVNAETWTEPQNSDTVLSHLDFAMADKNLSDPSWTSDVIWMKDEWMNSTGFPPNNDRDTSAYQQMIETCQVNYFKHYERYLSAALSVYMIDAVAGLGDVIEGEDSGSHIDAPVQFSMYKYAYAYNFKSSSTNLFAFSILLFHVFITLAHLGYILSPKHRFQWSSWRSFGQILVLALRSEALRGLGDMDKDTPESEVWRQAVIARLVGEEGQLQIILKKKKGEGDLPEGFHT